MDESSPVIVRWGDLPLVPDTESGIAAIEREQITKPRSMELDGPQLFQPNDTEYPAIYELPSEHLFTDKLVINSLKLAQHAKKLRGTLQMVQQQQEMQRNGNDIDTNVIYPPLPSVPIGLENILIQPMENQEIPVEPKKEEKFHVIPQLDDHCVHLILRKAVAMICAHVGFEVATESILNILVDVLNEYYLKVTHALRAAADQQNLTRHEPFPDILEQVFHEIGVGSVRKIEEFYKERVINYHNHVLGSCQNLITEYEKLTHPPEQQEDVKTVKIKEENLPQIHFPESEDLDELLDHDTVIQLEGLQTLQNIEHESSTTLADDEGTKWLHHQVPKSEPIVKTEALTLDSDDDMIKETHDTLNDDHELNVELIHPTSSSVADIISPSPSGTCKMKIKKK